MRKEAIVYVDGGICSQICQYMHGYFLQEKGYSVQYDLSWFLLDGHDLNGKKNRKFDLNKLCPDLKIKKANFIKARMFKELYTYKEERIYPDLLKKRNYLGGYYDLSYQQIIDMPNILHMNPKLDAYNKKCIERIIKTYDSVCVHVRRGDMSQEGYYWKVLSPEYYIRIIENNRDKMFFFFSDDMDWVKSNIISKLSDVRYELVDHNSDDQGYLDLFLMTKCKNYICSSGSLGKIAAVFSEHKRKRVYLPDETSDSWINALKECATIGD